MVKEEIYQEYPIGAQKKKYLDYKTKQNEISPKNIALDEIAKEELTNALKLLSKIERRIIQERFFKKTSWLKLAKKLNLSESEVKKKFEKAMEKLRDKLVD